MKRAQQKQRCIIYIMHLWNEDGCGSRTSLSWHTTLNDHKHDGKMNRFGLLFKPLFGFIDHKEWGLQWSDRRGSHFYFTQTWPSFGEKCLSLTRWLNVPPAWVHTAFKWWWVRNTSHLGYLTSSRSHTFMVGQLKERLCGCLCRTVYILGLQSTSKQLLRWKYRRKLKTVAVVNLMLYCIQFTDMVFCFNHVSKRKYVTTRPIHDYPT